MRALLLVLAVCILLAAVMPLGAAPAQQEYDHTVYLPMTYGEFGLIFPAPDDWQERPHPTPDPRKG